VGGDGWAGRLSLYARGDFDGDGREDLMLLRFVKVDEGTVGWHVDGGGPNPTRN